MSDAGEEGVPQWKSWYRWPFLAVAVAGALMVVVGIKECLSLLTAIRTGAPEIVVETAMGAFPPLGIGFVALGSLAFFPRNPDNTGVRAIRRRNGGMLYPARIVTIILLAGLLLYPVCWIALQAITTNILTARGYEASAPDIGHTSGYVTTHWHRIGQAPRPAQ